MATTDQQLNNLIASLKKTASELKTTENGFKELNDAITQLSGVDAASNKLKVYESALLQVAEARKILSSTGANINITGLDAAISKLKEYNTELAKSGTRQPIPAANKPLSWQEQDELRRQARRTTLLTNDELRRNPGMDAAEAARIATQKQAEYVAMRAETNITFGKFRKLDSTTEANANVEQNALLKDDIAERKKQIAAEKRKTKLKEAQADKEQQILLEQDINLQRAKNPNFVSPESSRIQREGATEVSAEQSRIIAETQRAQAAARAREEARIAQQNLQGAGTKSAFTSVLGGTNNAELEKFNQLLGKYGMSMKNITGISKEMSTGVSQISFAMKDANGVVQQGSIHVDRFGRMLQDTSGKFQNLGDRIATNITKVLQWAISLGIVYGAFSKIGEAVEAMKRLQEVMVEIEITTGQSNRELQNMFDAVKDISDVTASDFSTGIESLNVALRTVSNIENPSQRSAAALTLLKDSMTLSKLAGIENKQAIDNLVASLKQMDQPLTSGAQLLDKWQAVSQASNTSMEDLSSTFAITAGAASDVGVGVDQLNGLIGAFSEATTLSATETGNALRAMFSNFTQPAAIETLNKYGVAVKDVSGEFRSFTEIFKQVSELARSGLLTDREVAELANALGGGSRRQAQVTALLTVQPRSEELADISQYDSAGKAQTALALKTSTLEAAFEKLQNAFDSAANSLGGEGGFLDLITGVVNILSTAVNAVNDITRALGPSTTALIQFGLAWAVLTKYGPNIQQMFSGVGKGLGTLGFSGGLAGRSKPSYGVEGGLIGPAEQVSIGRGIGTAALAPILMGLSQFSSGNIGAGMGAIIGGGFMAILSGNPLWAAIGGTIGQTIGQQLTSILDAEKREGIALDAKITFTGNESPEELQKMLEDYESKFLSVSNVISNPFIRAGSNLGGDSLSKRLYEDVERVKQGELTQQDVTNKLGITTEQYNKAVAYLDVITKIREMLGKSPEETESEKYSGAKAFQDLNKGFDVSFARTKTFEQLQKLLEGDLSKSDYKSQRDTSIPGSSTAATNVIMALNPALRNATSEGIKPFNDEWRKLKDLLSTAGAESLAFISETSSNLVSLNDELDKTNLFIEKYNALSQLGLANEAMLDTAIAKRAQLTSQIQLQTKELQTLLEIERQSSQEAFQFKGFTDNRKFDDRQIEQIRQRALMLQKSYGQQMQIPQDTLTDFAEKNPFTVLSRGGTFRELNDVIKQFWDTAVSDTQKAAKEMENAFQFQNLRNVDVAQKGKLQQAMNYYTNLLKKWGFNDKNEAITVLFKDNQVGQLIGSQTALQLALEDLTEVTKKQLDGIYNLPSGATAFIPLQSGQLLSNYTQNQQQQSQVNYGDTPMTPPPVGSYPLGNPDKSDFTPIEKSATDLMYEAVKERLSKGLPPYITSGEMPSLSDATIPETEADKSGINNNVLTSLQETIQKLAATFSLLTPAFKGLGQMFGMQPLISAGESLFNKPTAGTKTSEQIKINITQEKQSTEVAVNMQIQLDSRRLWEGIKKIAMADYQRLTASVGDTQRSRGNVI